MGKLALVVVLLLVGTVAVVIFVSQTKPTDERVFTEQDVLRTSFNMSRLLQADESESITWAAEGLIVATALQVFLFEGEARTSYIVRQTLNRTQFNNTESIGNVGLLCSDRSSCERMRSELDAMGLNSSTVD